MAQPTFVSTTPANKNVVLEEYTGINCTYCPDGHKRANEYSAANPGRVVVINIHQGSFANGTPNYKTSFGDALANQTGLQGYPSGTVNRRVFSGTTTALDRGNWATKGNLVLAEPSFVNVDATATIDAATRLLTVVVEAYYTDTAETAFNMLNVALLQNNVVGPQVGADKLTGQWGDTITADGTNNIPQGHFYTKTFTYTLPANINSVPLELGDLDIAVFVTKDKQLIYTGTKVEPTYTNLSPINASIKSTSAIPNIGCNQFANPKLIVTNLGQDTIKTMEIGYKSGTNEQQVYSWTGSISTFASSADIVLPQVTVVTGTPTSIEFEIKSINGVAQTNITNTLSYTKPLSPEANKNVRLSLTIDKYGSQVSWNVKNINNNIVAFGGPYTDTTVNSARLINVDLNLPEDGCYVFEILDNNGNGINSGFGIGGYVIMDLDYKVIATSNGKFGASEKKDMNLSNTVGLKDASGIINNANIYPNPANERAILSVSVKESTTANITIIDIMGRMVANLGNKVMKVGENNFEINTQALTNGMYIVKIATDNGISNIKSYHFLELL
ncbi:MAG: outer membrane protein Omp28 [Bacteroidetes bacterium]|nr:outer membrane protein Omp28 [Bacteroidota bacterium]